MPDIETDMSLDDTHDEIITIDGEEVMRIRITPELRKRLGTSEANRFAYNTVQVAAEWLMELLEEEDDQ